MLLKRLFEIGDEESTHQHPGVGIKEILNAAVDEVGLLVLHQLGKQVRVSLVERHVVRALHRGDVEMVDARHKIHLEGNSLLGQQDDMENRTIGGRQQREPEELGGVGVTRKGDTSLLVGSQSIDGNKASAMGFADYNTCAFLQTTKGAGEVAFLCRSSNRCRKNCYDNKESFHGVIVIFLYS